MTLFLLLVTIAAITPLAAVVADATRLRASALAVGVLVALVLGVLQFVGHHRIAARIAAKEPLAGVPAAIGVGIYYITILVGGICSAAVAQNVARAW